MTSTETNAALKHRCPLCHANPNEPCRSRAVAGHEGGRLREYPHSSRRDLATSSEERARYESVKVDALCCVCGNQRTVSSGHYHRDGDPNYHWSEQGRASGWSHTQTLKCAQCDERTRHAVLNRPDHRPDFAEEHQRIALGGTPISRYTDAEDVRRRYREMPFPRNPNLNHRRYCADAQAAWDDGSKVVTALCGESIAVHRDPRETAKHATEDTRNDDGYLIADVESDVELTDLETGLSWIAMDCVDCCRASNDRRLAQQRTYMEQLLAWFARKPENIDARDVAEVVRLLERLYKSAGN